MTQVDAEAIRGHKQEIIQVVPIDPPNAKKISFDGSTALAAPMSTTRATLCYLSATGDCWFTTGAAPTATADADGNTFLGKGAMVPLVLDANELIAVAKATGAAAAVMSVTPTKQT